MVPTLVYYLCPPGKWTKPMNMTGIILDHVVLLAVGPDLLSVPRDGLHCHRAPSSFKASSGMLTDSLSCFESLWLFLILISKPRFEGIMSLGQAHLDNLPLNELILSGFVILVIPTNKDLETSVPQPEGAKSATTPWAGKRTQRYRGNHNPPSTLISACEALSREPDHIISGLLAYSSSSMSKQVGAVLSC